MGCEFYTPSFGEVEGAYWFGPVRPSVRPSVTHFWQLGNSGTAYARIFKFFMWHVHENILTCLFSSTGFVVPELYPFFDFVILYMNSRSN